MNVRGTLTIDTTRVDGLWRCEIREVPTGHDWRGWVGLGITRDAAFHQAAETMYRSLTGLDDRSTISGDADHELA